MFGFESTTLWKASLASQAGSRNEQSRRKRLRDAFLKFRERAEALAHEIAHDLPDLTVHDITHLDALWETASLIAGRSYQLTPTEAFVMGGAFLVHDLAMSRAAYPEGLEELKGTPIWSDTIFALLRKQLGRVPSREELENPSNDIVTLATKELLRLLHAQQAERLPTARWQLGEEGEPYYLIEDTELRETYGRIIGRIAHSHWWAVDRLAGEFIQPLGAPGGYPGNWGVDALKLAALLRVADASHLDERRAPGFLFTLRKPGGISHEHWKFQNLLFQPRLNSDRLIYTSKRPFKLEEAPAWWLCFDTLRMVDGELRQVDDLLLNTNRPRLAAHGVAKVETPRCLVEVIPTDGWLPVDARVKVTDVAALARNIGGEQLYGDDKTVPLRELIQNASDAVRARRLLQGHSESWGDVYIRLGNDTEGHWIEVEDTGLGMSAEVLTGPLLDFGTSYWGSELMLREYPGLLSKGFQSTGKYGIGFFSVFMWGDRVRISTRRYKDAEQNTHILEFGSGLASRPILRNADESEVLTNGGTCVRVWLREPPNSTKGLLSARHWREDARGLEYLCEWLCPSIDVNIHVETVPNGSRKVVSASDWKTLEGMNLYRRVQLDWVTKGDITDKQLKKEVANLRPLMDSSGEIVGRACISFAHNRRKKTNAGIVTVGGLRANEVSSIFGIFVGVPTSATRRTATPIVDNEELARWSTEQAKLVKKLSDNPGVLANFAEIIKACGGETGKLPVAFMADKWVSTYDISKWKNTPNEILIISDYEAGYGPGSDRLQLNAGVLAVGGRYALPLIFGEINWPRSATVDLNSDGMRIRNTLKMAIVEALAKAWSSSFEEVLQASNFSVPQQIVGKRGRSVVKLTADVIRNPHSIE